MHSFLRPLSLHSGVPPDDVVLCSSILNSSLVVKEEQCTDGVVVTQPTCIVTHEEYEWELEHQNSVKDDSLPSEPPPFFPSFFRELPSMILHVCFHPQMHPLLITHGSHQMLVHHLTMERISYSLNIHLIHHLSFPEILRMSSFSSHLPLYLIHLIMRISNNSLIFLIMVVVIHLLPFFIMIMNLSQLIFRSH